MAEHKPRLLPYAIEEHSGNAVGHEFGRPFELPLDRADQEPVDAVLLEDAEIALFTFGRLVARAKYEDVVAFAKNVFCSPHHFGKEGVANIEQYHTDRAALPHPQLVGRSTADEPRRADGVEDPVTRGRGHGRRVVEHIGHSAERNVGEVGDITDGDPAPGLRMTRPLTGARPVWRRSGLRLVACPGVRQVASAGH